MTAGIDGRDTLELPGEVADAIRRHAAEAYPAECCGALLGSPSGAMGVMPFDNAAPADRERRFLVTPADYRRAEARADADGGTLVGFYHSHPDHPAEPSTVDLELAWPNVSYVIVSVRAGRADALRSWRLHPDRRRFVEQTIATDSQRGQAWRPKS